MAAPLSARTARVRSGTRPRTTASADTSAASPIYDGQVITVNGAIDSASLGSVLTHEHLILNHPAGVLSNKTQAVTELKKFKNAVSAASTLLGTKEATVLSLTSRGLRWDNSGESIPPGLTSYPDALKAISASASVNIVMGSGYYKADGWTHPDALDTMSIEAIEAEIISDIRNGVPGSGIRAGAIGEVGISRASMAVPLAVIEEKVLIACALAQARTGVGMSIHFDTSVVDQEVRLSALRLCEAAGADPQKIAFCHCSTYAIGVDDTVSLARAGAFVGLDLLFDTAATAEGVALRVNELKARGCLAQILLSHDIYDPLQYAARSYDWVLTQVVPLLQTTYGFTSAEIRTLLVDNPRRLLAIRSGRGPASAAAWFRNGVASQNLVGAAVTTKSLTSVAGHDGTAAACGFNGTSSYIAVPHHISFNAAQPFTVSFWMKAGPQPGPYAAVVDKHHGSGNTATPDTDFMARWSSGWVMQIFSGSPNLLKFAVGTGSTFVIASTSPTFNVCDNTWRHFAGVYTGEAIELYANGILQDRQPLSVTPLGNNRQLYIGRWGSGSGGADSRYFKGQLQDVNVAAGVDRRLILA